MSAVAAVRERASAGWLVLPVAVAGAFVAASGRVLPSKYALGLTLFVVVAAAAWRFPRVAVFVTLVAVCGIPIYWTPDLGKQIVPTPAVVTTALLVPAAARRVRGTRLGVLDGAVALFVFLLLASLMSTQGVRLGPMFTIVLTVGVPYGVMRLLGRDLSTRLTAATAMLVVALPLVLIGLRERAGVPNPFYTWVRPKYLASLWAVPVTRLGTVRASASFGDPIAFGMFLAAVIVLAAGLAATRKRWALPAYVGAGVATAGLVATLSRGPLIATVAALVMWGISRALSGRGREVLVLAAVGLMLVLAVPTLRATVGELRSATTSTGGARASALYRLTLLDEARQPGQFTLLGHPNGTSTPLNPAQSIDSEYLLLYLVNGILPAAALIGCGLIVLAGAVRPRKDAVDTSWLVGAAATMLALTTVALITQFYELEFMILGFAGAALEHSRGLDDAG